MRSANMEWFSRPMAKKSHHFASERAPRLLWLKEVVKQRSRKSFELMFNLRLARIADLFVPAGHRQLQRENQRADLVTVFADLPRSPGTRAPPAGPWPSRRSPRRRSGSTERADCESFRRRAPLWLSPDYEASVAVSGTVIG